MTRQILSLCSGLLLAFTMLGCQPATERAADPAALRLVREAEKLQEGVRLGQRLNSLSVRDHGALTTLLNDLKVGLLLVAEDGQDLDALRILKRGLIEWDKAAVQLQRIDEAVFTTFLAKVWGLLNERSQAAGVNVEDLSWALYINDFATGVEPFTSVSNGAMWESDSVQDQYFVRIKGTDLKAWLITPTFDLRNVKQPSFRIEHLFNVDRNTNFTTVAFDRKKIVTEAFKVLVSTNYEAGDPAAANWEPVDISPLPSSYNFHAVQSPLISLEKFRGEKVAIAFLFDFPTSRLGRHYVEWQIRKFELFGAGPTPNMLPRPRNLWAHSFNSQSFKPFQAGTFGDAAGAKWLPFATAPGAPPKTAKVRSNATNFEAWLISPLVKLEAEELSLSVKEAVRNPDFAKFRMLISKDYQGGDPRNATWLELERPETPLVEPDTLKFLRSGPFDLTAYQNQTIALAFQFVNDGTPGDRSWDIENLQITGKSATDLQVLEKDYKLAEGQKPAGPPVLQSYVFTKTTLDPFVTYSAPESASTWAPLAMKGVIKYAKAGSGATAADTWLLSPRMNMRGKNLSLSVKHTVKNPDWSKFTLRLSTDYVGGNPQSATWTDLAIAPAAPVAAEKWADLIVPDIDLSKYSGQDFVIAFRYQDAGGPGARIWEIEALTFKGEGKFQATGVLNSAAPGAP